MDNQHQSSPTTTTNNPPHVVIFPLPLQGPVNCMLKLAELILSLTEAEPEAAVSITFINTDFIQRRLTHHSDAEARLARFGPRFRFEVVPDGLGSEENPRGRGQIADMTNSLADQAQATGSRLREMLAYGSESKTEPNRKAATCIIADGLFGFMVDVAKEIGVPLVYFETVSPCGLWTYLCVPNMVQAGELPFQGEDLDASITSVPGMEGYLRRRDLPNFCRSYDTNNKVVKLILKEAHYFAKAQGHILNTFDDLEAPLLTHFRAMCPNLYTIGPLHLHLNTRVGQERPPKTATPSSSNSLWQEDRSCLGWLDAQPPKSVLFVSIGSLAVMTKHQLLEFWHGIVNSKARFLWVRRPGSLMDMDDEEASHLEVPKEVLEGTRERGCLVSWAPQEEVLAHMAIGGFLTHSGWNSTLESMVMGVPMICWPFFVDQQVNSRVVSEVWGIGLDMKDTCDKGLIEQMIRDLMGAPRRDEFNAKAGELAKLAAHAVSEHGSSFSSLNCLIDDIKFMRFPIPS